MLLGAVGQLSSHHLVQVTSEAGVETKHKTEELLLGFRVEVEGLDLAGEEELLDGVGGRVFEVEKKERVSHCPNTLQI